MMCYIKMRKTVSVTVLSTIKQNIYTHINRGIKSKHIEEYISNELENKSKIRNSDD